MSNPSNRFHRTFGEMLREFRTSKKFTQNTLGAHVNLDHSIVSKWEAGRLYPKHGEVFAVADALKLSDEQRGDLIFALEREQPIANATFLPEFRKVDGIGQHLEISIQIARTLRQAGKPKHAMQLAERDAANLNERLRSTRWGTLHEHALPLLAELYVEQCKAALDYMPRAQVKRGSLKLVLNNLNELDAAFADSRIKFFSGLAFEGTTYVGGDVDRAFQLAMVLVGEDHNVPKTWLGELLRAAAINAGKAKNRDALVQIDQKIVAWLDAVGGTLPLADWAFVFEGLARGWGYIDVDRALAVLERISAARRTAEGPEVGSPLRLVQEIRTEAEVLLLDRASANDAELNKRIASGLALSTEHGFERYIDQLNELRRKFEPS